MPDDTRASLSFQWLPGDSRLQRRFLLGCHGLALAALGQSGLPPLLTAFMGIAVSVSAAAVLRRGGRPKLRRLACHGRDWELVGPNRRVWRGRPLPSTWLSRWLILLHFRLEDGRFLAVPLWCDSLDAGAYRRLQVVLRWWRR